MKSFLTSAMRPPSAESTPGVVGMTTCDTPTSAARKQAIIGPAPPNACNAKLRGSTPAREISFETSRYMPETAILMIASAASSMVVLIAVATAATAARALSISTLTAL